MFGTARLSLLTGLLCLFSTTMSAGTFIVDDLGDAPDVIPGDGVCATEEQLCTLRAAIVEANAVAGGDTIAFNVAGTIAPVSDLPTILQRLTIDGTTAPDYAGVPVLVLDGGEVLATGLNFGETASASRLIGLKIIGFAASGVTITASNVEVQHNFIGPIGGGTANFDGIVVAGTDNQIGTGQSAGNVISGNANHGVVLSGSGHCLLANRIGTTADGFDVLGNGSDGIRVFESATNIFISEESELLESVVDYAAIETIPETVVRASTDFSASTPALPPVKPTPAHPTPTLSSRQPATPKVVAEAPVETVIAVEKRDAVPAKDPAPLAPATPVSLRSKLGLMLVAAGTALAALLRMIR